MNNKRHIEIIRTPLRLCRIPARRSILLLVAAAVLLCLFTTSAVYPETSSAQYKEYEVKAAFMYNFLKFVNWPKEKMAQDANQVVIGIIGEDPFGSATDIFRGKTIEERQVVVKRFEGAKQLKDMPEIDRNKKIDELRKCHLLFVCSSEQKFVREIIDMVSTHGVLTVADTENFIESGGIVNFFLEDNKIRFDINLDSAEKAGLEMRSQLLRLARKVVKDGQNISAAGADKQKGK